MYSYIKNEHLNREIYDKEKIEAFRVTMKYIHKQLIFLLTNNLPCNKTKSKNKSEHLMRYQGTFIVKK